MTPVPDTFDTTDTQKLMEVLAITRALTAEHNLNTLLTKIVEAVTRLLGAERSTLYLLDQATGELVSHIAQGANVREIRLPPGVGLASLAIATGETVMIPHAYADPRFNRAVDLASGFVTRDMLVAPVFNPRAERIGAIQVMNSRNGFSPDDVVVLEALAASAGVALDNARLYEHIEIMIGSFVNTVAASIDARDPQTAGHSRRVASYAQSVSNELQLSSKGTRLIHLAGLLHDYGKIGVPEAILTKPGSLTAEEMLSMRGHATLSREILANVQFTRELNRIPDIVFQHHERMDGEGYPRGLRGEEIALESRILAVCDVFDALTARRYYRDPASAADAFAYIESNTGNQFDGEIVAAFGSALAPMIAGAMEAPNPALGAVAARDAALVGRI